MSRPYAERMREGKGDAVPPVEPKKAYKRLPDRRAERQSVDEEDKDEDENSGFDPAKDIESYSVKEGVELNDEQKAAIESCSLTWEVRTHLHLTPPPF